MDIRQAIADGFVVVAASDRIARDLRVRYSLAQRNAGATGWFTPEIHSFRAFIASAWRSTWPKDQLLYGAQELSLWLYAVESTEVGRAILNKTSAARSARQMGRLIKRHGVTEQALDRPLPGDDERAFLSWRTIVGEKMASRSWITEEDLPWRVIEACSAGVWAPPPRILWVGFLHEAAVHRAVREAAIAAGAEVVAQVALQPASGAIAQCRPQSRLNQFRIVAARARDRLMPWTRRPDADTPRLAILVPDVEEARLLLEPVLREFVSPQASLPGEHAGRRPWRYSRGLPLAEHPMIATALDVLAIEGGADDLSVVSRVLLSPWVFGGCSLSQRAELELGLREAGGTRFRRSRVQKIASGLAIRRPANTFYRTAADWFDAMGGVPEVALPSQWAERWESLLATAGWGGAVDRSRELGQVATNWAEAIDAFRAMDSQVREVSQARAVIWLREILGEMPFQQAVEYLQPIQILGYDDAIGMAFDWVAVLDFTAKHAPSAPQTSGFVAADVLRDAGMLEATPDGCLAKAARWVEHLPTLAPVIEVYAPHVDDGGAEQVPSTLIGGWGAAEGGAAAESSILNAITAAGVATRLPEHDLAPPVGDPVAEGVRGGVSVLKGVAISPFVAFARARLGLREFPEAVDGLDARVQGEAVHRVLELVWRDIETSDQLRALDDATLDAKIDGAVHCACITEDRVSEARYGRGLAAAEQGRIASVCKQWMRKERERVLPFRVVLREAKAEVNVGGLALELRIDRVDEITEPGRPARYLVIDYKTGASRISPNVWDADDLEEPQLPLYATFADLAKHDIPRVDGIAFGRVTDGDCSFVMLADFAKSLFPLKDGTGGQGDPGWSAKLLTWRGALERMAQEFMAGSLRLDRVRFEKARYEADLKPLVRNPIAGRACADTVVS